jgi:hypothetical protein
MPHKNTATLFAPLLSIPELVRGAVHKRAYR